MDDLIRRNRPRFMQRAFQRRPGAGVGRRGPSGIRGFSGAQGGGIVYLTPAYDGPEWTFTRASEASNWDPREGAFASSSHSASWTPEDIEGVQAFFRADTGVTLDGAEVSAWVDSVSGESLARLGTGPSVATREGQSALYFTSSTSGLQATYSTASHGGAQPVTRLVVFEADVTVNQMIYDGVSGAGEANLFRSGLTYARAGVSVACTKNIFDGTPHLHVVTFDGSDSNTYQDDVTAGGNQALGWAGAEVPTGITIGSNNAGTSPAQGWVWEVVDIAGRISRADLQRYAYYVEQRYGLTVSYEDPNAWLDDGVPRVFSDGAILIEGARTNLLPESSDFTAWDTTGTSSVTGGATTAPDGSSADQLNIGVADAVRDTVAAASVTDNATVVGSVWLWTASGTDSVRLQIRDKAGGVLTSSNITVTTTPTRHTLVESDIGVGATDPYLSVLDSSDNTGATVYAWGAQLEEASFATSPIDTAAAARADDSLAFDGGDLDAAILTSGFVVDVWPTFDKADIPGTPHVFFASSTNGYLRFDGTNCTLRSDTASSNVSTPAFSAGDKLTFSVDWAGGVFEVFLNGVSQGTADITGQDWSAVASDTSCWIGSQGSIYQTFGAISRFRGL